MPQRPLTYINCHKFRTFRFWTPTFRHGIQYFRDFGTNILDNIFILFAFFPYVWQSYFNVALQILENVVALYEFWLLVFELLPTSMIQIKFHLSLFTCIVDEISPEKCTKEKWVLKDLRHVYILDIENFWRSWFKTKVNPKSKTSKVFGN